MPTLLNLLRRKIEQVSADGTYDTKECYALLKKKGVRATIPPRKSAALWEEGVEALKAGDLKQWKQTSSYHQRSKAKTAMYRFKQLIRLKLSLRNYNAQVGEVNRAGWREGNEQNYRAWYAGSVTGHLSGISRLGKNHSALELVNIVGSMGRL